MLKKLLPLLIILPAFYGFNTIKPIEVATPNIGEDSVFSGYPTPKDANMLFYIQKSFNTNAVVYTLNIDDKGQINKEEPINVFWRRYQEQGQKRDLKYYEKTFGFGVKSDFLKDRPNTVEFTIVALKKLKLFATVNTKGEPTVATTINGKPAYIEKVFITAEHTKLLPEVFAVELFGKEIKTGKYIYERIEK
jgi:hypothetical protein|tara:strand:- start:4 stop:579 length:576 start_codon:yes stop_codon:yes gene_type:complete